MTIAKSIWRDKLNDTLKPTPQKSAVFLSTVPCMEMFGLSREHEGPLEFYNWQYKSPEDYTFNVGCWELDCKSAAFHNLLSIPLSKAISDKNRSNLMICIVLDWQNSNDWLRQLVDLFDLVENEIKALIPENLYIDLKSKQEIERNGNSLVQTPEGILTKALGVPCTIILTNSHKSIDVDEERADFMIQSVRSLSLAYGSSILSVSNLNPDTVSALKEHLLYSLDLIDSPPKTEAIERDHLCIPWNWDSFPKIDVIRPGFDTSLYLSKDFKTAAEDYQKVVSENTVASETVTKVKEEKALDEQEFLESLLKAANLETDPIPTISTSPVALTTQKLPTGKKLSSPTKERPKEGSDEVSAKIARLLEQASAVQKRANNRSTTSSITTRPDATQNEKLSSFFDSLLKK